MINWLLFALCFCAALLVGGIVADYIFPHVKWIDNFIYSLPMMQDK